ncbi:MAG: phosphatase PAP2 family protein [Burkholderiales bacterium]|nr:phosphatase PAP2 family protein [Burkholderiales bacterium]
MIPGIESLLAFDDAINVGANAGVGRVPMVDMLVHWAAVAPAFKFGVLTAALCWIWARGGRDRPQDAAIVIATVLSAFLALFVARALGALLPFRPRPLARPELALTVPPEFLEDLGRWSAFPSDHAVLAFALATGLMVASPRVGRLAFVHAAMIVCLPRLYFGLHHLTDLLAGALLGSGIALIFLWPPVRASIARWILVLRDRAPGPFHAAGFLVLFEVSVMFQDVRTLGATVAEALGAMH